jgi:MFS family permease
VAALLASRVPETREPTAVEAPPAPLIHPAALVPGLGLFTGIAAGSGFLAFASLDAARLGLDSWSIVLAVYGIVVVACRLVFATLPDRVVPLRLAAAALTATSAGLVLVAAVPTVWALLVGATVLAVGSAFLTPAVFAAVFTDVPPSQRGSAAGTASVFIDLGLSGGPVLLGLVTSATSLSVAFVSSAGLALAGSALLALRQTPGTLVSIDPDEV